MGATSLGRGCARGGRATAFLPGLGLVAGGDDAADYEPLLNYLNTRARLRRGPPGSAADRVGIVAEVVIDAAPEPAAAGSAPAARHRVPAAAQHPRPTRAPVRHPVRRRCRSGGRGTARWRSSSQRAADAAAQRGRRAGRAEPRRHPPGRTVRAGRLRHVRGGAARAHRRRRCSCTCGSGSPRKREVVIEPAVPISIGPCRFSGLPCRGVHDLGFLPYPTLSPDRTPSTS